MTKGFSIVVAMDRNRGIGLNGKLPWKLPGDMRFFRELTTNPDRAAIDFKYFGANIRVPTVGASLVGARQPASDSKNAVIMGRKTWDSLPATFKPLPSRLNFVLSHSAMKIEGAEVRASLFDALSAANRAESGAQIYVIGGAQTYAEALKHADCERVYATVVDGIFDCDVFFPEIPSVFRETAASDTITEENGTCYRFRLLQRDIK